MKQKLIRLAKQIAGRFPTKLPTGVTEFNAWAESFSETYDLPTQDRDSIKIVLASTVINLGSITTHKPKAHFLKTIIAASAKQVAGSVFQEIQQAKFAADRVARRDASAFTQAKEVPNDKTPEAVTK
jgi:hypothetical protein